MSLLAFIAPKISILEYILAYTRSDNTQLELLFSYLILSNNVWLAQFFVYMFFGWGLVFGFNKRPIAPKNF